MNFEVPCMFSKKINFKVNQVAFTIFIPPQRKQIIIAHSKNPYKTNLKKLLTIKEKSPTNSQTLAAQIVTQ